MARAAATQNLEANGVDLSGCPRDYTPRFSIFCFPLPATSWPSRCGSIGSAPLLSCVPPDSVSCLSPSGAARGSVVDNSAEWPVCYRRPLTDWKRPQRESPRLRARALPHLSLVPPQRLRPTLGREGESLYKRMKCRLRNEGRKKRARAHATLLHWPWSPTSAQVSPPPPLN